ncbi:hypothetical protein [Aeromonas rivipollensis]|uniref:hypothetical protein n=1 Tax=Aeromonas rivipollensis TaxID=948519 RepID=UPI001F3541AC|nr:hypothetical protein [Aeromonas rivipollensis]MCE9958711.1 hypothetical protein [Aeromonas rivipollensis]
MTEPEMATFITEKIVKDVQFWTATIGFSGVIAGAIISTVGNVVLYKLQQRKQNKNDIARKNLLKKMLDNPMFPDGRSFETLSRVTGTTPDDCHRLLIELEARGFTMADGRIGWTYIKNRPLDEL